MTHLDVLQSITSVYFTNEIVLLGLSEQDMVLESRRLKPYENSRAPEDDQLTLFLVAYCISVVGESVIWDLLEQTLQSKEHMMASCTSHLSEGSTTPGRPL